MSRKISAFPDGVPILDDDQFVIERVGDGYNYKLTAAQLAAYFAANGSSNQQLVFIEGETGEDGMQGVPGIAGATGAAGSSSSYFNYHTHTVSTSGDPGSGQLLWNNATQISATQININHINDSNVDIDIFLALIGVGQTIIIQDASNSGNYQSWTVSATTTHVADYWEIPVTLNTSAGTGTSNFPNNHNVIFALTAAAGTTGATGPSGPSGAFILGNDGEDGADGIGIVGPVGATGATGSTGPAGASGVTTVMMLPSEDPEEPLVIPGAVGATGAAGTPGSTGATGKTGSTMYLEPELPDDPMMVPGIQGIQGIQGIPGTSGSGGSSSPMPYLEPELPEEPLIIPGPAGASGGSVPAANSVTRAMLSNTAVTGGKNWVFLGQGTASAATSTGTITWAGTFKQLMVEYFISGYAANGIGRILVANSGTPSPTATTCCTSIIVGVTASPATTVSNSGWPTAIAAGLVPRYGWLRVSNISGVIKYATGHGQYGGTAPTIVPTQVRIEGMSSQTTLIQTLVMTSYTLATGNLIGGSMNAGTFVNVWGRNDD